MRAHRCISASTSPLTLIFHRTGVNIMPRLQFPTRQRFWPRFAPHGSTGNRCRQRPRSSPAAGAGIPRPLTNCARSCRPLQHVISADSDKHARLTDKLVWKTLWRSVRRSGMGPKYRHVRFTCCRRFVESFPVFLLLKGPLMSTTIQKCDITLIFS